MQTTTVDIEQGWSGKNCKIQYWGLNNVYYSLAKGSETPYTQSPDTPKALGSQMKDPPGSQMKDPLDIKVTRPFQRGLDP
jgi:hypothetical protein